MKKVGNHLSAVVWTTTPWTIPANQALCVNAELKGDSETEIELEVLDTLKGASLKGVHFAHPLVNREAVVLVGEHVTTDVGTGVVHTAPGHGQDDYFAWMAHHTTPGEHPVILCPVNDEGCFTSDAGQELDGLCVLGEGNTAIIGLLKHSGNLLSIMVCSPGRASRAPEESAGGLSADGAAMIGAFLVSVLGDCRSQYLPYLRDLSVRELLPKPLQDQADQYKKGMDTLDPYENGLVCADVYLEGSDQHRGWFQSSLLTSLARQGIAPYKKVITHGFTSDERGSKMSKSLVNRIVPNDFISGCTMPVPIFNKGSKKKSKGVNDPKKVMKANQIKVPAYGADVLRFWVVTTDYTGDVSIGPAVVSKASEVLRKLRNTARF
ncbi:unnamed protein product [Peronospora destructor]|nr:unnamed protein product [Peronospora destructor]